MVNSCYLEFEFEFEALNDSIMTVALINNDICVPVHPQLEGEKYKAKAKINITLPTTVALKFTGKNYNTDTQIDENGNIVKDVCVKITAIRLDGMLVSSQYFLHEKLMLTDDTNATWLGPYVGRNGTMTIEMIENSVFLQCMEFYRVKNS